MEKIASMKPNKSSQDNDIPAKVLRYFAAYLSEPLTRIINCAILTADYPVIWKEEIATPIPKKHPTLRLEDLRNINGLLNCNKIAEKFIAELIISDIEKNIDPAQYGNTKGKFVNHYLIKMIHRILSALHNNFRKKNIVCNC